MSVEPSVEETIAILRGLKEKYEIHHGVRIKTPPSSPQQPFHTANITTVLAGQGNMT
jgi:hypothetical protein